MVDVRLKTGLALVTRCQSNEAVGYAIVQVGCQMAKTEAVNEETKRNVSAPFVASDECNRATRQMWSRELNTNIDFPRIVYFFMSRQLCLCTGYDD